MSGPQPRIVNCTQETTAFCVYLSYQHLSRSDSLARALECHVRNDVGRWMGFLFELFFSFSGNNFKAVALHAFKITCIFCDLI
jgi:hypothetical protein